jgi:hypothetical protein
MQDFHASRRRISLLKATTDISDEKRTMLAKLEEQFQTSFKAINECEDVHTATNLLFDATEVYLNPDEEIARCEKIQAVIIKEIEDTEKEYFIHRNKKDNFQNACKTVIKLDFTVE